MWLKKTAARESIPVRHGIRATPSVSEKRKVIEQVFGWMKTIGGLRKLRHRGGELVDWIVTFTAAAYNLVRLRTLLARPA
jgi:Transposase DDE domain